ncbi:GNAT family N-acetyltransferase [Cohnella zeiphila]|uniref:GNAT family N-acetyltransferase n=1 Tax=Cohnella zeiphila TaxID=2761120 RepID=A0A7X0SRT6_9BACL|nr:GNAT family N-acetyltransferase [Cohnella zeiphila]
MHIRQLKAEEYDERIALSEFAFQMKMPAERIERERAHFRPEQHWGAFDEEGRLQSALILIPFECWVQGKPFRMGGIAGVATWPEARRNGCVAKLLAHSLAVMKEQKQFVSMLHPFAFPFYRKFGWELTIERKKYEVPMPLLPKRGNSTGRMERCREIETLNGIYERAASQYTGTLVRAENRWHQTVLSDSGLAAVWRNDEGTPQGYIVYEVRDRLLTVRDWAYENGEAQTALWAFIAQHDSMADRIELIVPTDDAMPFLLPDPRFKQEIVPYFMSRIVDVAGIVQSYPFVPFGKEERLKIRVRDEHAPWNDGTFELIWAADGSAEAVAAPEADFDACCDIRALTAMLLGNRRPGGLRAAGLLQGSDEAIGMLERRIPVRTPYLMDFF